MALISPQLIVDGVAVETRPGQNVLAACLGAGLDIPYFCWHPALGSVGSCRQCAVKVFAGPDDENGQIVMACMTPAKADLRVSIADPAARLFREQTIEFVLTQHPHDCPVCEVGGECHLQDMAALTGHAARRYRFEKRTHLNQYLGPFIKHEMNRCIGCYRCVRFYRDHAGGDDFGVFGANRNIYFGRAEDGALESPFAGNLVEVCPTGVFVDKPFSARFARKWDMRSTPSVCPLCAVGCNINVQERGGELRRVTNRYNETLNGYFLCDRGRFGVAFVESAARLRTCRRGNAAIDRVAARDALQEFLQHRDIIGIGSPRASIEANFALRALVGAANFHAGLSGAEHETVSAVIDIMRQQGPHIASVAEAAQADAVLILGDDPTEIAPLLALALRQAARRPSPELLALRGIPTWQADAAKHAQAAGRMPCLIATPASTKLDGVATVLYRQRPEQLSLLAFAIANRIDPAAEMPGDADFGTADAIAAVLAKARNPLIVAGGAACGQALLNAAGNITLALRRIGVAAKLSLLLPESNSLGLGLMAGRSLRQALATMPNAHVLVIENDLVRRADGASLEPALNAAAALCVLDHVETATSAQAELAIAVGSFAEGDGTTINLEGRAQRSFKAIYGRDDRPPAWMVLRDAGIAAGRLPPGTWSTHADLLADMEAQIPALAGCAAATPPPAAAGRRPASLSYRYSGRTAEHADVDVREPAPPQHQEGLFGTTMEGPRQRSTPGWNSGQAINKGRPHDMQLPGVFLFQSADAQARYALPPQPAPPVGGLMLIPISQVFGSEELSAHAPAIAARMAPAGVRLTPGDAQSLGLCADNLVMCETAHAVLPRVVVLDPAMAAGVAAVTTGFPGDPLFEAAVGSLRKAAMP